MKTNPFLAVTAAFGFAAALPLVAQAGGQSDRATSSRDQKITITGCLQRADVTQNTSGAQSTSGTSGTSGTRGTGGTRGTRGTGDAEQFVLLDARIGSGMTGGSSGANGQSAAAPNSGGTASGSSPNATGDAVSAGSGQRTGVPQALWYAVTGDTDDLRSRMDHRVEIIGTITSAGTVVGTSASATDGPVGIVHATSIRVINPSCNQ